jgi:O-methyltransferase
MSEQQRNRFVQEFGPDFLAVYEKCHAFTMTSPERMYALYTAAQYVVRHRIPGDFVECGVWRGGSAMLAALTFLRAKETHRRIWLFDTFRGMTEPGAPDIDVLGMPAAGEWKRQQRKGFNEWCFASKEEVIRNLSTTGYPPDKVVAVEGDVLQTLPTARVDAISILRLDTDWYESTKQELDLLYPRVMPRGVVIIDDYGYWQGARKAVDEYFKANGHPVLLNRIDSTGRLIVKCP